MKVDIYIVNTPESGSDGKMVGGGAWSNISRRRRCELDLSVRKTPSGFINIIELDRGFFNILLIFFRKKKRLI